MSDVQQQLDDCHLCGAALGFTPRLGDWIMHDRCRDALMVRVVEAEERATRIERSRIDRAVAAMACQDDPCCGATRCWTIRNVLAVVRGQQHGLPDRTTGSPTPGLAVDVHARTATFTKATTEPMAETCETIEGCGKCIVGEPCMDECRPLNANGRARREERLSSRLTCEHGRYGPDCGDCYIEPGCGIAGCEGDHEPQDHNASIEGRLSRVPANALITPTHRKWLEDGALSPRIMRYIEHLEAEVKRLQDGFKP